MCIISSASSELQASSWQTVPAGYAVPLEAECAGKLCRSTEARPSAFHALRTSPSIPALGKCMENPVPHPNRGISLQYSPALRHVGPSSPLGTTNHSTLISSPTPSRRSSVLVSTPPHAGAEPSHALNVLYPVPGIRRPSTRPQLAYEVLDAAEYRVQRVFPGKGANGTYWAGEWSSRLGRIYTRTLCPTATLAEQTWKAGCG